MARAWIFGNVLGTRTSGTDLDRFAPPCRRVDKPRGTGFTAPGVSPRVTPTRLLAPVTVIRPRMDDRLGPGKTGP